MTTHPFYQLDVFTETPLNGNPLAVFPDAQRLPSAVMQKLAREMNLSETTFVLPSREATRQVRFFTPNAEVPLAGHPTIGTWWLLAELGALDDAPRSGTVTVTQATGQGVLPVAVHLRDGKPTRVVMTQAQPTFGATVTDRAALGAALGADENALAPDPDPQVVSTAMPQLMVPVRSVEALERLPSGGSGGELAALLRTYGTDCAMMYALASEDGSRVRCRMFAPGLGVAEDPATGSASGALGAYLVAHGVVALVDGALSITIDQGSEIGRPSEIYVEIEGDSAEHIGAVRVGGAAVRILHGEVTL